MRKYFFVLVDGAEYICDVQNFQEAIMELYHRFNSSDLWVTRMMTGLRITSDCIRLFNELVSNEGRILEVYDITDNTPYTPATE